MEQSCLLNLPTELRACIVRWYCDLIDLEPRIRWQIHHTERLTSIDFCWAEKADEHRRGGIESSCRTLRDDFNVHVLGNYPLQVQLDLLSKAPCDEDFVKIGRIGRRDFLQTVKEIDASTLTHTDEWRCFGRTFDASTDLPALRLLRLGTTSSCFTSHLHRVQRSYSTMSEREEAFHSGLGSHFGKAQEDTIKTTFGPVDTRAFRLVFSGSGWKAGKGLSVLKFTFVELEDGSFSGSASVPEGARFEEWANVRKGMCHASIAHFRRQTQKKRLMKELDAASAGTAAAESSDVTARAAGQF